MTCSIQKMTNKSQMRQINLAELGKFDFIDWDQNTPFKFLAINALLTTMGVKGAYADLEKIAQYAFGTTTLDKRTGNTGITVEYNSNFRTVVSIPVDFKDAKPTDIFRPESPLTLRMQDDGILNLNIEDRTDIELKLKQAPSWYTKQYQINGDTFMGSQLVQWENGVLMLAIPEANGRQRCAYLSSAETACKFCGLEQDKYKPLTPDVLADIVRINLAEMPVTSITMTGGNNGSANRGFEKYVAYVERLRSEFPNLPIQLEVSPPREQKYLDFIVSNNLSFMSNLEVWDEQTRAFVIPAKSRSIPREEYLETFKYLNEQGVDTYSVLITSLQSFEDQMEGVDALAGIGTSAIILPFKPTGGEFADYIPTRATDLLLSTIGAASIMRKNRQFLDVKPREYCSGCGGCGIDANLRDNSVVYADPAYSEFMFRYMLNNRLVGGGVK